MFHVKLYVKILSQVGPGQPQNVLFKGLGIKKKNTKKKIPHSNTHFHNLQADSFLMMYSVL